MPTWTRVANTPIQRSSQTLSVVSGHAFIYGGELRPREPVDSTMYCLPIVQDNNPGITSLTPSSSTGTSATPTPRVGAASTTLNDKIYVFSGRGGLAMAPIEEHGSFWVFDTTTKTWAQVYPADRTRAHPPGRSYHALTTNHDDGTIYLHAGCPESGRLNDLWAFNTHSREWTELPPAPGPARGGPSIAYVGQGQGQGRGQGRGKLYRINGFDGKSEQGGSIDVFDFASGAWEPSITYPADGVSGPVPRSVACLLPVTVKGKFHLVTMFGEHDPSSLGHEGAGKMLGDVWAFDIESRTWDEVITSSTGSGSGHDETPVARGWFAAAAAAVAGCQSGVIVHGGLAESNERLGDVWLLDLSK